MISTAARLADAQSALQHLPSLTLTPRQLCDLELIANNGFAPLSGFMDQANYESVLKQMCLTDGTLWPMPITLDVNEVTAKSLEHKNQIVLRDQEGLALAILNVTEIWRADKEAEAQAVFATNDEKHPGVAYLFQHANEFYVSGEMEILSLPHHYDFRHLRNTPEELKNKFAQLGWDRIVGFQTRNPMHRAHQELTRRAAEITGAKLLLHPVVGMTKPGDVEYYLRVRCYEHLLKTYPEGSAYLSLLPLAMRMGGPREAVWHAIIRKNYGCTHFIVGRDHAGPGKNTAGENFYQPYAAQELALQHQKEIGIEIIPFQEMFYSQKQKQYFPANKFPADEQPAAISGTEFRDRLQKGAEIPEWFSFPAVIDELRKVYPAKNKQGLTIFFTGLPSSGKSTLANALALRLREMVERKITLLDGDIIRTHLSKGLGFSKEDRETNITRVGYVASEITKHGGIAICALVSPYEKPRQLVREMVSALGGFVEIFVATPLAICEKRDRKGLYKKAREGIIKEFTGVSDPYEEPSQPEIKIDTVNTDPEQSVETIIKHLKLLGYI